MGLSPSTWTGCLFPDPRLAPDSRNVYEDGGAICLLGVGSMLLLGVKFRKVRIGPAPTSPVTGVGAIEEEGPD